MQWLISLIVILFFQITPIFAEEEFGVELKLSSASKRSVDAKGLLTSVFIIANSGSKEDSYILKPEIPDGWQIVSSLDPVALLPKETQAIPLTVSVPSMALAGYGYELSLSAISQQNTDLTGKATITVEVLPRAKVKIIRPQTETKVTPGQSVRFPFTILNLGNGRDSIKITATSAHGEKVDVSKEIIDIEVGGQAEITATIHVPLDVSAGTMHCLTLRAESFFLGKGVFDEAIVYSPITEKRPKAEEGLYKILPATIITHLSGFGTNRPIGPQAEFYTHGYVTDTHWVNFAYQGPYFKDRENYRGLSEEKTSLELGDNLWDAGLGDIAVNISELTSLSIFEPGARFRVHKGPASIMYFELEKKQAGFTEKLSGSKISSKIGDRSELSVNYFKGDEEKTDLSVLRSAEKKEIISVSGAHKIENLFIQGEYAGSRFDDGSGEKNDKAWWVNSKLRKEKFYIDTEYINAGPDYPGRRKDNAGHRAYLSYNLFKPLWAWAHNQKLRTNLKDDPAKSTDNTDRIELGSSLVVKELPSFSLSYQINNSKSEKAGVLLSDAEEKSVVFRSHKALGNSSVSFDSKWSDSKDDIKLTNTKTSEYTARLYERWQKTNAWVGYSYNTERDIAQSSNTVLETREVGFIYQPISKFSSSFSFSNEGVKGEKSASALSFDVNYEAWDETFFYLEGEVRSDNKDANGDWQVWLTFKRNFDLPLFFINVRGALKGSVFIDENNNGVIDKGESGISEINLLIDENKAATNKNGGFKFSSLVPGECELNIDISSIPVGLAPRIKLPYKFIAHRGKTKEIKIPLVRTCKLKGAVFEDTNKNGTMDEEEKGIPLIRIEIISDTVGLRDTFTDNKGNYSFAGVIPGKYNVKIDTRWLPDRFMVTTDEAYPLDLGQAEEKLGIDFGAVEKERPILKTYSTQSAEPSSDPEDKQ